MSEDEDMIKEVWGDRTANDIEPHIDYAALLEYKMSDLSETCYCAGWLHGLEDILWKIITGERSPNFGMCIVTPEDVAMLKGLAAAANGWVVWGDDGRKFLPMGEWLARYGEKDE